MTLCTSMNSLHHKGSKHRNKSFSTEEANLMRSEKKSFASTMGNINALEFDTSLRIANDENTMSLGMPDNPNMNKFASLSASKNISSTKMPDEGIYGNVTFKGQSKQIAGKYPKKRVLRPSYQEVPYNITGWPISQSLSAEDYIDYFHYISILVPNTSRDSSVFDFDNNISILIGIGKTIPYK